jgi:hypothetical protein
VLSDSGTVGAAVNFDLNTAAQRYPRLAFDSGAAKLVVVYEDDRNLATAGTDIRGLRFAIDGTITNTFVAAGTTANEYAPRLVTRDSQTQEVVYWVDPTGATYDFDVYGQTILSGAPSGSRYAVSAQSNIREMTPALACASTTSCTAVYRWFNAADGTTDADRTKARVVTYP